MRTAVEWFKQQLDNLDIEIPQSIFAQVQEMEKQQIIDAYREGLLDESYGEQYYNENFKT